MDWIFANKEWLFSGLLVAIPIALVGWVIARRRLHRSQIQKSGDDSVNIQAGGNIEIGGAKHERHHDQYRRLDCSFHGHLMDGYRSLMISNPMQFP